MAHAHAAFGASRAAAPRASAILDRRRHRHRCAPARAIERDVREGKLVSDAEDFSTNVLVASAGAAGADVESVRVNEEGVTQAEETARALRASVEALTAELDACYRATFGSITLAGDEGGASASAEGGRRFEDMTETAFRTLNTSEPATAAALLKEAEKDIATWLSFQKNVHSIKARRDRARDSLAEAENALAVAKRGGVGFLTAPAPMKTGTVEQREGTRKIVLLSGFESFNVALYKASARDLKKRYPHVDLLVFSDRDIEGRREELEAALDGADVFFGSLLFDYDQVEWLRSRIADIPLRFVFESALELMSCTSVGSFQMAAPSGQKADRKSVV